MPIETHAPRLPESALQPKTKTVITKGEIVAICQVFNSLWGCDAKNSSDQDRWDSWLSQRAAHILPCFSIRTWATWSPVSCSSPIKVLAGNCENPWRTWTLCICVCLAGRIWPKHERSQFPVVGASSGVWDCSSCPGFELSAARCGFGPQGFLGGSEGTVFLSPSKMSLHSLGAVAEGRGGWEFCAWSRARIPGEQDKAGQSPGSEVLQWPGGRWSHGQWAPFGYSCHQQQWQSPWGDWNDALEYCIHPWSPQ